VHGIDCHATYKQPRAPRSASPTKCKSGCHHNTRPLTDDDPVSFFVPLQAAEMEALVQQAAEGLCPGIEVVCGGSYRRGKATCGDMDMVITHQDGCRWAADAALPFLAGLTESEVEELAPRSEHLVCGRLYRRGKAMYWFVCKVIAHPNGRRWRFGGLFSALDITFPWAGMVLETRTDVKLFFERFFKSIFRSTKPCMTYFHVSCKAYRDCSLV
jgi:hypothetical protein